MARHTLRTKLAVLAALFLLLAAWAPASLAADYTIKITHVLQDTHHYQYGAKRFKELVEAGSKGRIAVEIYPNAQLGGERSVIEGLQLGTIQMGIITSGALSGFVPEFAILDLGYLFKDSATAQKVLGGALGKALSDKMLGVGVRNLGFLDCGYRSVYAHKPVATPDDLKGIKIRTMENPAHQAIFKALGASPVPMAWPELYTGLQQGTVDAAENVIDVYYGAKHYEVAKHYSETNHVYLVVMYMMSERFFGQLPKDLQDLVKDSAAKAIEYENGVFKEKKTEAVKKLESLGAQIHPIKDLAPFQSLVMKSWDDVAQKIPSGPDNLKTIKAALGQ